MKVEIVNMIAYVGYFILALNVFLFFKSYRKKTLAFKIIAFYLLYTLILELRISYLASIKIESLVYSHFYFIGQFVFLSFFFIEEFRNNVLTKGIKTYLILGLIAIGIYYLLYPESFYKFNIFEILVTSIPLIVYSFIFFLKRIEGSNKTFIYLNAGLFIYVLCSTLLFVAGNLKAGIILYIWAFNVVLLMIYRLFILLEWYKNFRTPSIEK